MKKTDIVLLFHFVVSKIRSLLVFAVRLSFCVLCCRLLLVQSTKCFNPYFLRIFVVLLSEKSNSNKILLKGSFEYLCLII